MNEIIPRERIRAEAEPALDINADALARRLRRKIKGEVRFTEGDRALYATDGSNYRQVPIGVVVPRDEEDVLETVALCRQFGAPITSRGCGTSLAGQCCNVAVIIDFTKYLNRILEIDPRRKLARVQPGVVHVHLHNAAEKSHLTFGPDPATHKWCSIGGMLGNNSCGVHSQMAGRTADNVEALEILLYDGTRMRVGRTPETELEQIIRAGGRRGEIYTSLQRLRHIYANLIRARFPRIPRRVSGYNLDELLPENDFHVARSLVGSEGTCVVVLEAILNLVHSPPARSLLVLGYPDVYAAGDHVPEINESRPIGLEALDYKFIYDLRKKHLQLDHLKLLPEGKGFLLVEFGGETKAESDALARRLMARLKTRAGAPTMKLFDDKAEEQQIWEVRESGLGATAHIPGEAENWEGWEDSAVPPEQVGPYLRDLKKLFDEYGYVGSLYGHFGQGCIHTRINFDLKTAEGVKRYRSFMEQATDLVMKYRGSFSGEHGDGQSRAEFLPKMFGPELVRAFEEFKRIWDPDWKMNPGKVVKPYRIDENLRYGPHYHPPEIETHFKFVQDGFSFRRAMERCVGVGACRRHEHGTMCPSYMATGEEMHTTRGRARLLFEMLEGNPLPHGWKNEKVHEALDLCLACKGCKGDCPVNVDMATYKAEFLSHYYKGRLRPRHAYAFGLIHRWAKLAAVMPRVANFFSQSRFFAPVTKWIAGVAPERRLPAFAEESFKEWFFKRQPIGADRHRKFEEIGENGGGHRPPRRVVLWADTFNNYFHPYIARDTVEVLEDAGFEVEVPRPDMCCGRPLYDYGMLDTAEKWLQDIVRIMQPHIEAGTPVVVLEPSCAAVFRDELKNLFPNDVNARRLGEQTFLLSEFLNKYAPEYPRRELKRKAIIHLHCHQNAIFGKHSEEDLLKRTGLDFEIVDSGCCGMAGAFGFEKGDHYDVSVKCGERVLLPKIRETPADALILTNGFSCHEQMLQLGGRRALHIAEVLRMVMREGKIRPPKPAKRPAPAPEVEPEGDEAPSERHGSATRKVLAGVGAVLAGVSAFLLHRSAKADDE
jgi:FAD/FMN-containing dehydrogenase/Fe-S oxidoreductase